MVFVILNSAYLLTYLLLLFCSESASDYEDSERQERRRNQSSECSTRPVRHHSQRVVQFYQKLPVQVCVTVQLLLCSCPVETLKNAFISLSKREMLNSLPS